MKNTVIILTYVVLLFSCSSKDSRRGVRSGLITNDAEDVLRIVVFDNCEYVWMKEGYSGGLTHKGDCSNPLHAK